MAAKKRCFYLDFVRALAVISILMTHYNACYLYMGDASQLKKVFITARVCNIYIGDFGVALFLIISGAALMYTYNDKLDIKTFYPKRFWSIYPMFWIAYFICFSYSFIIGENLNPRVPWWRIIFTIIGFDGYLNGGMGLETFYLTGEWFLGFIIIIYIIFPILRKALNKYPIITILVVTGLYIFFLATNYVPFTKNIFLFVRLPEILFGMIFVKYIKKVKWWVAIVSALILVLNTILKPPIYQEIQMTYVGISSFILLAWLADFIGKSVIIKYICSVLSKYSYAVFLTHHFIINEFSKIKDMSRISVVESYILFIVECFVIGVFSWILFNMNNGAVKISKELINDRKSLKYADKTKVHG